MDEETKVKGFTFYRSYYEAAKELTTKEEQAEFLMAVCWYMFEGTEPDIQGVASAMFKLAKPNLETSIKRAKAGSSGSNKNQSDNKQESNDNQNENKTESNDNQNSNKQETIKDKGYKIKDKRLKKKIIRHKYGEYQNVLLSDEEMAKLQSEFPADWQERIERVSAYCRSTGKSYNDYLATIRNWARRESKEKPAFNPYARNDVQAGYQQAMALLGGDEENG